MNPYRNIHHRLALFVLFVFLSGWAEAVIRLQPVVSGERIGGGCSVTGLLAGSPAMAAGIQLGDAITDVGTRSVNTPADLRAGVNASSDVIHLKVRRGEKLFEFSNIRPSREIPGAGLGINCVSAESTPQGIEVDAIQIAAQASLVQDLALVRVKLKNNSKQILNLSPQLFSAADGDLMMLKRMEPGSVANLLQADLNASQAQQAAAAAANAQIASTPDPFTYSLGYYIFGQLGLKGDMQQLATNVATGLIQNAGRDQTGILALPPPSISPGMVAREALEASELEPGYSAEGIIFFTVPKKLPLTLKTNIRGKKSSMVFDSSEQPGSPSEPETALPGQESPAPDSAAPDIRDEMTIREVVSAVQGTGGRCLETRKEQYRSAVEYVDCVLVTPMIMDEQAIVGGVFTRALSRRISLSPGAWTLIFRDGRLVNHKTTFPNN